jgi:flagellar protein FlgJ
VVVLLLLLLVGVARAMMPPGYSGSTPEEFVAWIGPHAREGHRKHGIPASVTIAQAALESGWGASRLARDAANLFGIKAGSSWRGRVISATTREFVDGEWVTIPGAWRIFPNTETAVAAGLPAGSLFRVYWKTLDGLADHARVLYNGLYDAALAHRDDPEAFAHALTGVYATDPGYGVKLVTTMRARNLTAWDAPSSSWALDPGVVPPEYRA